jgi:hypothetical protein
MTVARKLYELYHWLFVGTYRLTTKERQGEDDFQFHKLSNGTKATLHLLGDNARVTSTTQSTNHQFNQSLGTQKTFCWDIIPFIKQLTTTRQNNNQPHYYYYYYYYYYYNDW